MAVISKTEIDELIVTQIQKYIENEEQQMSEKYDKNLESIKNLKSTFQRIQSMMGKLKDIRDTINYFETQTREHPSIINPFEYIRNKTHNVFDTSGEIGTFGIVDDEYTLTFESPFATDIMIYSITLDSYNNLLIYPNGCYADSLKIFTPEDFDDIQVEKTREFGYYNGIYFYQIYINLIGFDKALLAFEIELKKIIGEFDDTLTKFLSNDINIIKK